MEQVLHKAVPPPLALASMSARGMPIGMPPSMPTGIPKAMPVGIAAPVASGKVACHLRRHERPPKTSPTNLKTRSIMFRPWGSVRKKPAAYRDPPYGGSSSISSGVSRCAPP